MTTANDTGKFPQQAAAWQKFVGTVWSGGLSSKFTGLVPGGKFRDWNLFKDLQISIAKSPRPALVIRVPGWFGVRGFVPVFGALMSTPLVQNKQNYILNYAALSAVWMLGFKPDVAPLMWAGLDILPVLTGCRRDKISKVWFTERPVDEKMSKGAQKLLLADFWPHIKTTRTHIQCLVSHKGSYLTVV